MARTKGGANKAQMVRDAVAELGDDAKPLALQELIKKNHGVEISATMISSYKSNMKKKEGKAPKGPRGRKPGTTNTGATIIADITTIRALIGRHGKAGVLTLIDALS